MNTATNFYLSKFIAIVVTKGQVYYCLHRIATLKGSKSIETASVHSSSLRLYHEVLAYNNSDIEAQYIKVALYLLCDTTYGFFLHKVL